MYMKTQTGELQSAVTLVLKRPSTGKIFTVSSRRQRQGRHEYRFRIRFCPVTPCAHSERFVGCDRRRMMSLAT